MGVVMAGNAHMDSDDLPGLLGPVAPVQLTASDQKLICQGRTLRLTEEDTHG
jgi:hypothetical protein